MTRPRSGGRGLSLRPTAMLPRVWGGLSGADPAYQRLAAFRRRNLPCSPKATAGGLKTWQTRWARSTVRPDRKSSLNPEPDYRVTKGKGIESMFEGEKA